MFCQIHFHKDIYLINHCKGYLPMNTEAIYPMSYDSHEVGHSSISSDHKLSTEYLKQTCYATQRTSDG